MPFTRNAVDPVNVVHIELVEKRVGDQLPCREEDGYCITNLSAINKDRRACGVEPLVNDYHDWELRIFKPWLEKHGFKILAWRDGERDSFGPLTRVAVCKHLDSNKTMEIWYG